MDQSIEIKQVHTRKDMRAFILFPWQVYKGDPNWVPPLISERYSRLNPDENPFFRNADVELYLARRRGKVVGTVAAFVDHRSNERLNANMAGFGFYEVIDDYEVAKQLLDTVVARAHHWGMDGFWGPTNFGRNDEPGFLIQETDAPPALLEAHTPLYYDDFMNHYGMEKKNDFYAWRVSLPDLGPNLEALPEELIRVFEATAKRGGVEVRKVRMDDWDRDLEIARNLFNVTLTHLPDHVPMDEATWGRFANQLRPLLDPDLALFAEVDGKAVGFLVCFPDMNRVLIHLNGRMFPIGWLKLLWYSRRIDVVSFKLFGVLEQYRRRGIDVLLYLQAVREAAAKGYDWLDGSLTSEFNPTVVRLAERLGAERYKHYRLYKMVFDEDGKYASE
ncbi:MAG TPA: GNAT family N-acetyltransferase [Anaerolineae bacterium]|nr:GNAT family N-acetyltransferase [Anaerolineae bacterium]